MSDDLLDARAAAVGCTVRPVRDADGPDLRALVGGVFAEYPGCVLDPDGLDADLHAWASHLAERDGVGWVVHDEDGRLVACVGVARATAADARLVPDLPDGADVVELKRLYVHADARRAGLGSALVARVEDRARDRGAVAVVLWSDTRFDDAHRLYAGRGYREVGRQRDLHDPSDTTETAFVKVVATGRSAVPG